MNIGLTGMPGTMKSTVGRALSRLTGMALVDTDEVFESEEGATISETFERKGEEYFRRRESEIIARECGGDGKIISFGGGAPLSCGNRENIKRACFCVRLTASPEKIAERCCGSDARPLLKGDTLARVKKLAAEREEYYAACAHMTIDTTDLTPEQAAERIAAEYFAAEKRGGTNG